MFIKEMRNEFHMALGEPSLKLGLEEGFTKSTAESATGIHELEISYCRINIKQVFGDLFKIILDKMGYDGKLADVQLNFGAEETAEYKPEDIFTAVKNKILTPDEARALLSKYHKWDIKGKIEGGNKPLEIKPAMPFGNQDNKENNKVSTEDKEIPKPKEEE
jgi:hypothetical protein